ncbi:integrase catalytic subunit (plasmid) [Gordonia polyisoprenivorans VH2]|uniref:Integrase catalytic subunit n=1 Tax=Gordonia polyisoprenivorans (strain DSM 44266 / VH2) TaxID=1112204 RepID=H6N4Y2_GORPV|nr:integrase catalytic subunit [Gordonia polyisoprenivorans VH2]
MSTQERVNHKRVARVMAEHDIVGYRRRRRVVTTTPEPADDKVTDLVKRDFTDVELVVAAADDLDIDTAARLARIRRIVVADITRSRS